MKASVGLFFALLALGAAGLVPATAESRAAQAEYVVVIGLDGARPEIIQQGAGPVLHELIQQGSVSWNARAVHPTVTQVNWASMLTSSRPDTHSINMHPVTQEQLADLSLQVPTVFQVVAEHGGLASGFLGHWKLYPVESDTPGTYFQRSPYEAHRVAPLAADHIEENRPTLCFIWMGNLDGLGHRHGWLSDEQFAAMPVIDRAIGQIVQALRDADMWNKTLLIISSDHGGHGRGHGQGTEEDTIIPWIAVGPGVRQGHVIQSPVSIIDTAATALHALGLPRPDAWDGKPVDEIFETTND
ncbi:alkaline phosphatase family protein [Phycisphaerales bacterium AB-hyl4]|uniref:Alkaline phosphatase family protein n=1 Tax=Natronomicrosphaera hydrolytica TaxID=3242702 RepID=A0ABV4U3F0_9BACT